VNSAEVSERASEQHDPIGKSSEVKAMRIRLGYELVYDCSQPTSMCSLTAKLCIVAALT
jgi:hypothetical protein